MQTWKSRWRTWSKEEKIVLSIVGVFFAIYSLTLLYPFLWAFINSFKSGPEYYENPYAFPMEFNFNNFVKAFSLQVRGTGLLGLLFNSVWMTLLATVLSMTASVSMAYALAKYNFKGRNLLYMIAITIQIIPIVGSQAAMYRLVYNWNIANNPLLIGLLWISGFDFTFIVMYSYFKSVSWSFAEAAFIDGASHYQVFYKVMVPIASPAIIALTITVIISRWNDYMTPFLYMPNYPNLSLGIYILDLEKQLQGGPTVYFAAILISIIPILIIFIMFQDKIMHNTVAGGLKG